MSIYSILTADYKDTVLLSLECLLATVRFTSVVKESARGADQFMLLTNI